MTINVIPINGLPYAFRNNTAESKIEAILDFCNYQVRIIYNPVTGRAISIEFDDFIVEFESNPEILQFAEFHDHANRHWVKLDFPKAFPWTKKGG